MAFQYEEKKKTTLDFKKLFGSGDKNAPILREMFRVYKWKFFLSTILYVIKDSPVYIVPLCTSNIINIADAVIHGTASDNYWLLILINSVVILGLLALNIPLHTLYAKIVDNMIRNASADLREAASRKLQSLSLSFGKEMESGEVQSKFIRDIDGVENYLSNIIKSLIPAILTAVVSFAIAVSKNWMVACFFLLVIPANVALTGLFRKKIGKNYHDYRLSNEGLNRRFTTMMEMLPVTRSHGLEENEIAAMNDRVTDLRKKGLSVDYSIAVFGSAIFVLGGVLGFACLIFCVYLALGGFILIGDVVLYQSLFSGINSRVSTIVNIFPALASGKESLRSIGELMRKDEIRDDKGKLHLQPLIGKVDFKNVSFHYPDDLKNALSDFTLHVQAGECVAFTGPSGSGKTTVMNLIIGLLHPTAGEVLIDDHNLEDISLKHYHHHISVVPQNPILFHGTIKENITYGLKKYTDEDVKRALHIANCDEFIEKLPEKENTIVEEHGSNLSGGQKQRLTIARAIIRNPSIIIFDEATSALDNLSEHEVQKAIAESIKGRTTFIVAHRISTIQNADRILYMDQGKVLEGGTYDELLAKKGAFYRLKNIAEEEHNARQVNTIKIPD